MKGILIVAHGSRTVESNKIFSNIVESVKEQYPNDVVVGATLMFSKIDIKDCLLQIINQDIKDILVIPYFLFDGTHVVKDIPNAVNDVIKDYPTVKVTFADSIGKSTIMKNIVFDLIEKEKR